MKKAKDWFPNDKATHDWLDSLKKSTRSTYLSNWKHFLGFVGMTGDQVLADRKQDKEHKWERLALQFKQWLMDKKGLGSYAATAAHMTVRGFFSFHYEKLEYRRQEAKRAGERTRKTEDYRFSRKDLKKMCDVADLTEKYVITAGKSFGFRAGDFLRLTRGDLTPYLDREVPISIGELGTGKEKVPAYPFIDADALPIIKLMVDRMNREGRTNPNDRILTYSHGLMLSQVVRRVAERAGITFGNKRVRFHCLRKFLTDHLASHMSESKWKQVVGKSIDEKAYVSADELRKDYARVMAETCWAGISEIDTEKRMLIVVLKRDMEERAKKYGLTKDDLKEMFATFDIEDYKKWLHEHPETNQPIGGGLPFEVQAKKALAEIILGAFEEIKKQKKTGEES